MLSAHQRSHLRPTLALSLLVASSLFAACLPSSAFANNSDAVVLEFTASWCKYCQAMKPVMTELRQAGIPVRSIDVDKEEASAVRFGIKQLPTYVIMSGGRETSRLIGKQDVDALRQAILKSGEIERQPTNSQTPLAPQTRLSPRTPGSAAPAGMTPVGRTSASDPMPSELLSQAVARAETATVRLRVFEGAGFGTGTGTIIDRHDNEYLVLTCGHLFRESSTQAPIEVDLFAYGQKTTVEGHLVDFNAKERDIALVAIRTDLDITPVPLLGDRTQIRTGDSVFSFGCDRGADPSRRDTRITAIDKYDQHLGLSNIEIGDKPVDGRSGGGLFNSQGQLIGVCNAAAVDEPIGIYAGPGEVRWQLSRLNLTHLLDGDSQVRLASGTPQQSPSVQPASLSQPANGAGYRASAGNAPAGYAAPSAGDEQEMIIILRNRNQPNQPAQVKVLAQPPAHLLDLINN